MKKNVILLGVLFFASSGVWAQGLPETSAQGNPQQSVGSASLAPTSLRPEADLPETNIELPDMPIPKDWVHERGICPQGVGRPCALLGGLRFYGNSPLTEHDKTWVQAMKHPVMWISATALVISTAYDAEGTRACLRVHSCFESNPLMGKHPSRARMYGTAMPLNAIAIYAMGRLKKQGVGGPAVFITSIATVIHCYFGMSGFAAR